MMIPCPAITAALGLTLPVLLAVKTIILSIFPNEPTQSSTRPRRMEFGGLATLFDMLFGTYHTFQTERRSNENLTQLFRKASSSIFEMSPPFGPKIVYSIEPANVKAAWAMNFDDWGLQGLRAWALAPLCGPGIVTVDGKPWHFSRSMLRPSFSKKRAADLPLFTNLYQSFIEKIPMNGHEVNLLPLLDRLGFDTASILMFGGPVGAINGDDKTVSEIERVIKALEYCELVVCKRMEYPQFEIFCRDRRFFAQCEVVQRYFDKRILHVKRKAQGQLDDDTENAQPYIFAEELLRQGLQPELVRQKILNTFIAARGAVGSNVGHVLFLLARHPKCWQKLREEVLSAHVLSKQDYGRMASELRSLPYLRGVIHESFRLLPTLGFTERIAVRETYLPVGGGNDGNQPIRMDKGDTLVLNFSALHRRKEVFGDDADEFRPERWQGWTPPPWPFIPFGGGPRICIGQEVGFTQICYALAALVTVAQEIENCDPVSEFVELYRLLTVGRNGIKVAFKSSR